MKTANSFTKKEIENSHSFRLGLRDNSNTVLVDEKIAIFECAAFGSAMKNS